MYKTQSWALNKGLYVIIACDDNHNVIYVETPSYRLN
jgi:hypothetical protein